MSFTTGLGDPWLKRPLTVTQRAHMRLQSFQNEEQQYIGPDVPNNFLIGSSTQNAPVGWFERFPWLRTFNGLIYRNGNTARAGQGKDVMDA